MTEQNFSEFRQSNNVGCLSSTQEIFEHSGLDGVSGGGGGGKCVQYEVKALFRGFNFAKLQPILVYDLCHLPSGRVFFYDGIHSGQRSGLLLAAKKYS